MEILACLPLIAHIFDWMSTGWVHLWPFNSSANMRSLSCLVHNLKWQLWAIAPFAIWKKGVVCGSWNHWLYAISVLCKTSIIKLNVNSWIQYNPTSWDTCGWDHVTWNIKFNRFFILFLTALIFQTISVYIETGVLPICAHEVSLHHPLYSPLDEWQL